MMRRYLLPGVVMPVSIGLAFVAPGDLSGATAAPMLFVWLGLYVLACVWWTFAAMLDRRRLAFRLPLIWVPALPPMAVLAWMVHGSQSDSEGAAILISIVGLPILIVGVACVSATILAPFYGGIPAD